MKSHVPYILAPVLLLAGSIAVHAAQFGDFTYESSGTEITITGYTGPGGDVAIPGTINGMSVTRIGSGAFSGCTNLSSVGIGSGAASIGDGAFDGCTSLTSIEVDALNPNYSSLEGVLFNKNQTTLILCPGGKAGSYTIPNSVTTIGSYAFQGCGSLDRITIPDSVTRILDGAFAECTSLTGLYFEGVVPDVCPEYSGKCDWSFRDCPALISYYRAGSPGWCPTFAGRLTALWIDPPVYSDWLPTTALPTQYPQAAAEADDPDQDGMSNYAEMLAGTDPTDRASLLTLERVPRPNDLTAADQTPIGAGQHALCFRSVPGKQYGIQWAVSVGGPWNTTAVVTPSTTQKRLVYDKPATHAFYRVILAQ